MSKMYDVGIISCEKRRIHGCPLCGGKPIVASYIKDESVVGSGIVYGDDILPIRESVRCPDCDLMMPSIREWNKLRSED